MEYDLPLFRPPSEARSLIFQVTLGCSWNRCRFCVSYGTKEFRMRPYEDVEKDVIEMSECYPDTRRIFLADGDPLAAPTDHLVKVLDLLNRRFPSLERISTYAGPTNLMAKSPEELGILKERKLDLLYIDPQFLATLTLIPLPDARTYEERIMGRGFRLIDPTQSLRELRWFVEDLELSGCKFGTEHASNYLPITGMTLPRDKDEILRRIDKALMDVSPGMLRPEWMRGL